MAKFHPKMAGGVANPNASDLPGSVNDGSNVAYTAAPSTSHVYAFKYLDARVYKVLKKFPGRLGAVSLLFVIFREKHGGAGPVYQYGFADPDAGQQIHDRMAASPHPYGQVLYPDVIKAGVPYTKV